MNEEDSALPPAQGIGLPNDSIERIADQLRDLLSFDPIDGDIFSFVEGLNCKVEVVDASKRAFRSQGTLEVHSRERWSIYIPEHSSPLDDRYTIAHELGHYVLHSRMGANSIRAFRRFDSREPVNDAEREADAFALSFLMPRRLVEEKTASTDPDSAVDVVAAVFHVDRNSASIRLDWIKNKTHTSSS